jgi:hypothetical protein
MQPSQRLEEAQLKFAQSHMPKMKYSPRIEFQGHSAFLIFDDLKCGDLVELQVETSLNGM